MKRLLLATALLLASCGGSATAPNTPPPVSTPAAISIRIATGLADAAAIIQGLTPLTAQFPGLKDPLNRAIIIYTTVKAAEVTFDAAVTAGGNPDPAQITADLTQLLATVGSLRSLYAGGKP